MRGFYAQTIANYESPLASAMIKRIVQNEMKTKIATKLHVLRCILSNAAEMPQLEDLEVSNYYKKKKLYSCSREKFQNFPLVLLPNVKFLLLNSLTNRCTVCKKWQ